MTTLVPNQAEAAGLAVDGTHLYWARDIDGTIDEANLDGTGVKTLVSGLASPIGVAVDGGHIYGTINIVDGYLGTGRSTRPTWTAPTRRRSSPA